MTNKNPLPVLLVVEDVHWADGATLDVLRYLGTRVQSLPAVLLMTYRDDALARDHPLRGVLGALGSTAASRLRLTSLTSDAVRAMAAPTSLDPGELFELTGGRSEERRVGKECRPLCRSRWARYH